MLDRRTFIMGFGGSVAWPVVAHGQQPAMQTIGFPKIWADLIPKAKVLMVPGVGHLAMQEAPATVTAIGDFLERG